MKKLLTLIVILSVCGNMALAESYYYQEDMPVLTPKQRTQQIKEQNYLRVQHANSTSDYFQSYQKAKPTVIIQNKSEEQINEQKKN